MDKNANIVFEKLEDIKETETDLADLTQEQEESLEIKKLCDIVMDIDDIQDCAYFSST